MERLLRLPWNCKPTGNSNFLVASKTNFEPRVGIAWSTPNGDTVIRAGFGMFYDQLPVSLVWAIGLQSASDVFCDEPASDL